MRKVTLKFRIALWLARRGFFRYEGLRAFAGQRGIPLAQVHYPTQDGWTGWRKNGWRKSWRDFKYPEGYSVPMAIGNAVEYADFFGGTVVPLEAK